MANYQTIMKNTKIYEYDIPSGIEWGDSVAVDTEAMGLVNKRDRLCVVQMCDKDCNTHVVHFPNAIYDRSSNLKKLIEDRNIMKIFHYARFDVAIIKSYLDVWTENCYCTKIASRLARTYTNQHSLKALCEEFVGLQMNKRQQSSDWGASALSAQQLEYVIHDVIHLHAIRDKLNEILVREKREHLLQPCLTYLKTRIEMDMLGWGEVDILAFQI